VCRGSRCDGWAFISWQYTKAKPAGALLKLLQEKISTITTKSDALQDFFIWIYQKSFFADDYKPYAVRAFYFALVRLLYLTIIPILDPTKHFSNSKANLFINNLVEAYTLVGNRDFTITLDLALSDNPTTIIAHIFALDFEPQLKQLLLRLHLQLALMIGDTEQFSTWRKAHGQKFIDDFRNAIDFNLSFNERDKALFRRYCYAHDVLMLSLNNSECDTAYAIKDEIRAALLLPLLITDLEPVIPTRLYNISRVRCSS
jgi:hypothetical protein